ncbi:MAG: T9SS type A sorting domain-containing protein [Bacteroidota bacterium]
MKTKKCTIAIFLFFAGFTQLFSQSEYVNQIIIAEGAGTKVYVSAYNPVSGITTVFDSINVGYVNDVLVDGNFAFVAATDSVIKYDIDNYSRIDQRKVDNVNKLAVYNDYLIAGRWITASNNIWLRVYDKNNLSSNVFDIPEIDDQTYDIVVENDTAYIVVYGGYGNPTGKIGVIDLTNQSFQRWIDLGNQGEGIGNLLSDGFNLYPVFETWTWNMPSDTIGGIGIYNINNSTMFIDSMNYDIGRGYFVNGTALFLQVNNNIGVYDLYNQTMIDTSRITKPAGYGAYCAVVYDRVNNKIYINETDYFSYGQGYFFDLSGNQLGTYNIGISAEAMDIDYRISSGIEKQNIYESVIIYPNPATDLININNCNYVELYKLFNSSGKLVEFNCTHKKQFNIDISKYSRGVYFLQIITDDKVVINKIVFE